MATPPERERFLQQGDELWDALWAKLGALSDGQLARPGASGPGWSGTDVLAHLARWHDHALEGVRAIVEGREPVSRSDFDEWNARWHEQDGGIGSAEARSRCEDSRGALRDLLAGLDRAQWDDRVHGWAESNMNEHYRDHLDELATAGWPD